MAEPKTTILHVDDDDANRYAVTRSLFKAGFAVTEACDGATALKKIADQPDLVILDIRLPDIDGFEVCRRIKADPRTASIPVLHLSASLVSGEDKAHGLDGGADGYLIRPVEPVELVATVRALLRARRSEEQLRAASVEREKLLASEQAARAEAERASRMKDEFLATLSHELRTPLNAILGWATILRMHPENVEDVREGLDTIERNARAQTKIIEDLLDMSRIISGKVRLDIQNVDLGAIVQAALETAKPAADAKGVELRIAIDPRLPAITGDSSRLQQVLWNLLSNSIKFTHKGGQVKVLVEQAQSHVEITVSDTGEGIDPSFLPFVFDRFRQADATTTRLHGGLGLGLSIVKQLIELHGGSVRAKSLGKHQGATFAVSLPVSAVQLFDVTETPAPPLRESVGPTMPSETRAQIAGVKVLVVDDEPDAQNLVKRLLEDCHAHVVTAGSAVQAMALLQETHFDVLVCDIGMPGEDGYSLLRRLRALGPAYDGDIPAVALTAYARAEDRVKAVVAGFQMHVSKPVEPTELIAIVAALAKRPHN